VELDVDVFVTIVEHWVLCKRDGLIVHHQSRG
jgi:hypothetical protein